MDIENETVASDIVKSIIKDTLFQNNRFLIIKISLIVLIVGGAEIFRAININHQKVMLGIIVIKLLNISMLRVWNFIYKSLVKKKSADEVKPWATIIIMAPILPRRFIEKIPHKVNPIWATEE